MPTAPWADAHSNRLHDKLSAILTICQRMNSVRELGSLLDLVAREATRLLDADRASIFLLDREYDGTVVEGGARQRRNSPI